MSEKLQQLSEDLIKRAKMLGATASEAIVVENNSLSIEVKNHRLEKIENSETLSMGVRVFVNSQSASASISSIDKDNIDTMIIRAIAMARQATPDELNLPAKRTEIRTQWNQEDFDLYDKSHETQDNEKLTELVLKIENSALEMENISQCESTGFGSSYSNFFLTSSNGFSGGYKKTAFQLFCSVIAGHGSSMERDYNYEGRAFFDDLPNPISIGKTAAKRAADRLYPKKPPTGSFPVIFERRVSSSLIGHLTSAINGAAICRGSSWLLKSLDKKILPENLTLSENPNRPRIFGSRPFDGEGLPTFDKNFVERGMLKQYILDLRSARKLNLTPSGNAYRTVSSNPIPGVENLELTSGPNSLEELIQGIKNGLLVTSLIGSTINQNTGDYSRGASGFWIENGQVSHPVNECTIAGNLKEMFLNIIPANDSKTHLSAIVPSLLVEKMTVAGH